MEESSLTALSEWRRVADHRIHLLSTRANVETYLASHLSAAEVLDFGFGRIVVATGARWRTDGVGRANRVPVEVSGDAKIVAPEDILAGRKLSGQVLVYDDDQYYLASALAQHLCEDGCSVTFVTPASVVSPWSEYTLEQHKIQHALMSAGADIACNKVLTAIDGGTATLECGYLGTESVVEAGTVVPVTSRTPNDVLYAELHALEEQFADCGIKSVDRIGDCYAPGTIAMAVYAGHQYARQLDESADGGVSFKRENYFGSAQF